MFERFTQEARECVTRAHFITRETQAPFIEAGHLLVGVLDGEAGRAELEVLDVEVSALRDQVLERLAGGTPSTGSPPFSPVAKKALELSLREALLVGSNSITPLHLLRGLVRAGDSVVDEVLAEHDVTLDRLVGGYAVEPGPGSRRGRASRRFRRSASAPGMGPWFGPGINHLLSALVAKERGRRGSHHLLMAMADDDRTMAGRLLKDLGVTREVLEERAKALGTEGTVDDDGELRGIVTDAERLAARAKKLPEDARRSAADILRAALTELEAAAEEGDEGDEGAATA